MPFFDPVPARSKDPAFLQKRQESSPRRWLAWFAIPVAALFTWLAQTERHDGGLDNDGRDIFIAVGMLAGVACILFSRPRVRALKWIFFIVYGILILPIASTVDFMVNGMGRLF